MSRRLVVRPAAQIELAEASDWYDENREGLGGDFIRAYEAASAAIVRNPFQCQIVYGQARRAPLRPFQYGLIHTVSDDEVVVVACIHGRRDPQRWQERLPE
jgi:hypothetical protein